ncbi:MAG: hypothetical protein ACO3JL_13330 [Myxococcota bacterium]
MTVHNWDGNHSFRDFERGFQTKNVVKGLNGGVRGVDFHDDNAEHADQLARALATGTTGVQAGPNQQVMAEIAALSTDQFRLDQALDLRLIVPDVQAQQASAETQRRLAQAERVKRKLLQQWQEEDDEAASEESEEEAADASDAPAVEDPPDTPFASQHIDNTLRRTSAAVIETLMADPEVELRIYGTLRLQNPHEMREALSTPLRIARHLNVIARRLATADGTERAAVVAYVASCMQALGQTFGGRVLASFCNGVGIGEVYPLEVLDEVLANDPHFVPGLSRGRFTTSESVELVVGEPGCITVPDNMKVTGFAIKGGGDVGYEFFPAEQPGSFHLLVDTPGRFRLLLRGQGADKRELLEELTVRVLKTAPPRPPEPVAGKPPATRGPPTGRMRLPSVASTTDEGVIAQDAPQARERRTHPPMRRKGMAAVDDAAAVQDVPTEDTPESGTLSETAMKRQPSRAIPIPTHLLGLSKTTKFD